MKSKNSKGFLSRLRAVFGGETTRAPKGEGTTRIFFASDIHGSNLCFRLFLNAGKHYGADVLIIGGDVTGKFIVPIVRHGTAGTYSAHYKGESVTMGTESEAEGFKNSIADDGVYGFLCDEGEYQALSTDEKAREDVFKDLVANRMTEWVELADEKMKGNGARIFFNAGNDDFFFIDKLIDQSEVMIRPEGKVVEVDQYLTMISTGFANQTPFNCPRDIPEDKLRRKIDLMSRDVKDFSHCIFNLHCPPYGTVLDRAPKLDNDLRPKMTGFGVEECSAGSTAVRDAIAEYQPCLALHGHIHESPGVTHVGRTLCINPGSEYGERILRGVLIDFHKGELKQHNFTRITAG